MLAFASLSLALRPLPSSHCARPRLRYGAAFACTSSTPAELAQQAIQSGDALQIEEAMRAIIDLERSVGRPEADIPNNPLLQQLSAAQRQLNPEVFAAGSAESPEVFSAEADLSDPAVIARAAAAARQAGAEDVERQEPPPQAGVQAWGQWRHGAEGIEVQLELASTADGPVRAKGVRVEVVDGCLFAQLEGDPAPLLFGRFRHDVKASELSWMIDESERGGDDDARVLCVEVPWRLSADELRQPGAAPGRIFDESLHIYGEPCLVPGLSCISLVPEQPAAAAAPDPGAPRPGSCPSPLEDEEYLTDGGADAE